jgi:DNA-directed RNA polymerase specialized sigma24 family protein
MRHHRMRHHRIQGSRKERKERESAVGRGTLGESGEIPVRLSPPEYWAVAEALASLRQDHREVLVETYFLGRSVADAAAKLGIPAGIVKSRAFYALKAFKLALEERGRG